MLTDLWYYKKSMIFMFIPLITACNLASLDLFQSIKIEWFNFRNFCLISFHNTYSFLLVKENRKRNDCLVYSSIEATNKVMLEWYSNEIKCLIIFTEYNKINFKFY